MSSNSIESLMPKDVAFKAENAGVIKANLDFGSTMMLSLLAGAFIGFGAVFSNTVMAGNGLDGAIKLPFGLVRLIGGASFCLGLILVTIAGAEMFTGNVLLVMAAASRKIGVKRILRNWGIVWLGNFIGATATAYLVFLSGQHLLMNGQVGLAAIKIADYKCHLPFTQALVRAIFCNTLVCLAYWVSISGRTVIDKVIAIIFPITAFVTSGFEHSVANMFYISMGLFLHSGADQTFWQMVGASPVDFSNLNWSSFLIGNLLPVTIGNTLGGIAVGLMYWAIYCRPNIMMHSEDAELLKRLTRDGRRHNQRIDTEGMVTLRCKGREFHGRLKNLSQNGLMADFYSTEGLPAVLDTVMLDLDMKNGAENFVNLAGSIVNTTRGKNLMGRDFLTYSIKLNKVSDEIRQAIKASVAPPN